MVVTLPWYIIFCAVPQERDVYFYSIGAFFCGVILVVLYCWYWQQQLQIPIRQEYMVAASFSHGTLMMLLPITGSGVFKIQEASGVPLTSNGWFWVVIILLSTQAYLLVAWVDEVALMLPLKHRQWEVCGKYSRLAKAPGRNKNDTRDLLMI
jgi:hypothetical protein